jgi:putative ABC transport system permease protein
MGEVNRLRSLIRNLFRRERVERELDAEVRSYQIMIHDQNAGQGMKSSDANRSARIEMGGPEQLKEEVRSVRAGAWLESVFSDVRFGLRSLRKSPGFTATAVLTLALGIGAVTTIFSAVNATLLRPLPYADDSALIVLNETDSRVGDVSVAYPDFLDWRSMSRTFSQISAANNDGGSLAGLDSPQRVEGYDVSSNFLSSLGVSPLIGRDFQPQEEKPGTAPVMLISYNLWQQRFGGDPAIVGKSVTLDDVSFSIIGVLPSNFRFVDQADYLAPIGLVAKDMMDRGDHGDLVVIGRLAPGTSQAAGFAEIGAMQARIATQFAGQNVKSGVAMTPLREVLFGAIRPEILILFGAVCFVLLIACVNVANLYLVRAASRNREIALRMALGAGRARIARQILTESALISLGGGVAGIVMGLWGMNLLVRVIPMGTFQDMGLAMDRGVLLFTALTICFVAIAFGVAPAWQASRADVQSALKEGSRGSAGSVASSRLRGAFAIAEMAMAMVLLIGAGLMLKSLENLLHVDGGFRVERVLTGEVDLGSARYNGDAPKINFWRQTLYRVRVLPGVVSAGLGSAIPLTDNHDRTDITFDGMAEPANGAYPHPDLHSISAGYLQTLQVPLLRGRDFADSDTETSAPVVIINHSLAQHYFPDRDPVGQRMAFGHFATAGPVSKWRTIVGVVADTKLYGMANPSRYEIYLPFRQYAREVMTILVRSAQEPASLAPEMRQAVAQVDSTQALFGVSTMTELLDADTAGQHSTLVLLGVFSGLALALAAIGIYGVLSYSTARRTNEIGIRMALGAQRSDVLSLVLGECAWLAGIAVAGGAIAALLLTRLMSKLLFGVHSADPLTFVLAAAILAGVAFLACWIPARRAMRVDPMIALRYE